MGTASAIRVIKPGTYTSVEGTKVSFTLADLEAAAAAYDAESDPAPLVIGHPKLDAPAYGWAKELKIEDGELVAVADPATLEPAFAEAVNAGRYRRISGRFYQPNSAGNPKPGSFYLQHIGFLGAAAPAVKGLGTVSLAEGDGTNLFSIETDNQENQMSDQDRNVAFAEREAEIVRREEAINAQETELSAREQTAAQILHQANVSFAEQLVADVKLAPAGKDMLIGLLDTLDGAKSDVISFGEGNAELAPAAILRKLLVGAQPLISLGEAAPGTKENEDPPVSFAAPQGFDVDAKRLEIHTRALEMQAADPNLSYLDACKRAGA